MKLYFAPLEGLNGYHYRKIHHKFYPGVDRYFAPFAAPKADGTMLNREMNDLKPENNAGVPLVPQILTNNAEAFLNGAERIAALGYDEINLNLGCPSGTVTKKGRGAGFLKGERRYELMVFLDRIFERTPAAVSVKTRIGWENEGEFDELIELYNRYPIKELIVHPRTGRQGYGGSVHRDVFLNACVRSKRPLGYNGDVRTSEDFVDICQACRGRNVNSVMIGRGLIRNPGLICEIKSEYRENGEWPQKESSGKQLYRFHKALYEEYREWLQGDDQLLQKLKELWALMATNFTDYEKYLKAIKKARSAGEYWSAVDRLFEEQKLL